MRISSDTAKLYSALLYWCEGSKYPGSNAMSLANSDPVLLRTFVTLLRKGFILNESKFRIHLQIHSNQDYEHLKRYWSDQLKVSVTQFIRPTITLPEGKKHHPAYYGTCTLKYQDYSLQLRLIGIYEDFARKNGLFHG